MISFHSFIPKVLFFKRFNHPIINGLLISFFCSISFLQAQEAHTVFINVPFNTPEKSDLYLTGKIPKVCDWEVKCLKMNALNRHTYFVTFPIYNSETKIEIKITRGHWDMQAATAAGIALKNLIINPQEQIEHIYNVINWKDLGPLKVNGIIESYPDFRSNILDNNRQIWVRVPSQYQTQQNAHFPVIYFHDGQNAFDPKTSAFGVDWALDDVIEKLQIPVIVVAIQSLNRDDEFDINKKSQKYGQFIVDELKPFIDKNYRTKTDRENSYLMGSSYGALVSSTMLWTYAHVFKQAFALSMPIHGMDGMFLKFVSKMDELKFPIKLYFDHGTHGSDINMLPAAKTFSETSQKIPNLTTEYQVFPFAAHTESDWARRLENIFLNTLF